MKASVFLTLVLLPVWLSAQGPISGFMPGGGLDLAVSYGHDSYSTYVFGEERREEKLTTRSVNAFLEYGTSDRFSLLLTVPYLWIDEVNKGLQDGSFFLKYQNLDKETKNGEFSLITALGLTFPFSNYPIDTESPIGQKATYFNARLNLQFKGKTGMFFFLQSGFDFRLIPSSQGSIPTLMRLGYAGNRIYLDAWVENYFTINAGTDDRVQGGAGSSWWRVGGTVFVSIIPELGAVFNLAYIPSGRNIGLSTRLGAGLVFKWRRKVDRGGSPD